MGEGWESKKGEYATDEASLAARATRMRQWLKERKENEIIVVTHGGMHLCPAMSLTSRRISYVPCARDPGVREHGM